MAEVRRAKWSTLTTGTEPHPCMEKKCLYLANTSENFDLSFITLRWGFLCLVWPSVLSLNNLKLHKTKAVKKHLYTEEIYSLDNFLSWFNFNRLQNNYLQQINVTWALNSTDN